MKSPFVTGLSIGAFIALTLAAPARATLITPVSASAESVWCCRPAVDTINGSGLTGLLHEAGSGTGSMWMSESNTLPSWIEWDLGADYLLSGMHVWNYNETNNSDRGSKTVTVSISTDGVGYTSLGVLTLTQAPGLNGYAGEDYLFSSTELAQYIRFDITETWGDTYTGIAEFRAIAAETPEPGTVGLVIAGAALVALRRRSARV
jgi:hypothetical protein